MKFTDSTGKKEQLIIDFEDSDSKQTRELATIKWNGIRSLIMALQTKEDGLGNLFNEKWMR